MLDYETLNGANYPMVKVFPLHEVAKALGVKQIATVERICQRFDIEITQLSPKKRGITQADLHVLLERARVPAWRAGFSAVPVEKMVEHALMMGKTDADQLTRRAYLPPDLAVQIARMIDARSVDTDLLSRYGVSPFWAGILKIAVEGVPEPADDERRILGDGHE